MSEFIALYQKEVEEYLALAKTQKIPAKDWKAAEEVLHKAQQSLKMMEASARGQKVAAGSTNVHQIACQRFRQEIGDLLQDVQKNELLQIKSKTYGERDVEAGGGLLEDEEEDNKQLLRGTHQTLAQATHSVRTMTANGESIKQELNKQKEQIQSAQDKIKLTNEKTQESRNLLRRLEHVGTKNKIITYGALGLVCVGVVVAMYFVLFSWEGERRNGFIYIFLEF